MEIFKIIQTYLAVILTWPVAFFVIALIFMFRFGQSIKTFLENIGTIKFGPFEANQRQNIPEDPKIDNQIEKGLEQKGVVLSDEEVNQVKQSFEILTKENEAKDNKIKDSDNLTNYLAQRAELYEFLYLSLFLVENSKKVLRWFNTQNSRSATKGYFIYQFLLPPQINDHVSEKEAILNALLVNGLISQSGDLYCVTEKANRFLNFIGL